MVGLTKTPVAFRNQLKPDPEVYSGFLKTQNQVHMAGITVELDGTKLTTIELDKLEVVDVSVHGALDQNPKARLSAYGGNYSQGGDGHLIWISEDPVPAGKL